VWNLGCLSNGSDRTRFMDLGVDDGRLATIPLCVIV
jgi:hypothetical protein